MTDQDIALGKISQFLKKEFFNKMTEIAMLQNEDGSYDFFNRYTVYSDKNGVKVYMKYNSDVKLFSSLKNALTWCIFENRTKYTQARRIEYLDHMIAGIDVNIQVHKNLLKKAKDDEYRLIYAAKLSEEQARRRSMVTEMSSFINESKNWQTRKFATKR
jgi:hypothetical protein